MSATPFSLTFIENDFLRLGDLITTGARIVGLYAVEQRAESVSNYH
jgi:hypothetical protein